jgi:GDPmannose 4,6-dehydratase
MSKLAIITGVTGQDGAYLSQLLLGKGYQVIGVLRRSSVDTTMRLSLLTILYGDHMIPIKDHPRFQLFEGDVSDAHSMNQLLTEYKPDELYNLAAQSHVHTSFNQPGYTWNVNANGTLFLLEAIRNYSPHTRFYQASTSEMFGNNFTTADGDRDDAPPVLYQDENTALEPTSPYAVAKLAAHHTVATYRTAYKLHASSGILFNHESPIRGENFVTRKITKWVANVACNEECNMNGYTNKQNEDGTYTFTIRCDDRPNPIHLGNIEARRDWGHAKDYVRAMWMMLQQDKPNDYVVATGETRSVLDFMCAAFKYMDWNSDTAFVKSHIYIDPEFYRPSDVEYLCGNPAKAKERLGWEPELTFDDLVSDMVKFDLEQTYGLRGCA